MCNNVSNDILKLVSKKIELQFGLYFSEYRFKDLKRCLINVANLKGIDLNSYIGILLANRLSIEENEKLANSLTIGETYFFRDKKLFNVLRKSIIPDIIESKRKTKTITIWSSGCSTGEEAYSIAILMKELLIDFSDWNINIVATDINLNSLRKARDAIYGEWSFRENDIKFKNKYFDMVQNKQYKLKEEIKKSVTFSYLNLAEETYEINNNLIQEVDIIFCRNVLMYFSKEQAKKIVDRYYKILNNKGLLILAPSESLLLSKSEFIPKNINEIFLYSKNEEKKQNKKGFNFIKYNEVKEVEKNEIHYKPIDRKVNKSSSEIKPCIETNHKIDYERQCREKANEGNLQEAMLICKKAIDEDKMNPKHYYLLSSIEQEAGNIKESIDTLRKVIYLDSNFIIAYFDLGNLFLKIGRTKEALKNFQNVNILLQGFSEEQNIPNTESITAGMLKHFITNILKGKDVYE